MGERECLWRWQQRPGQVMFSFVLNSMCSRLVELLTIGGMHIPRSIVKSNVLPTSHGNSSIRMHDADGTSAHWDFKPGLRPFPWRFLPGDYMPHDPYAFC